MGFSAYMKTAVDHRLDFLGDIEWFTEDLTRSQRHYVLDASVSSYGEVYPTCNVGHHARRLIKERYARVELFLAL